MSGEELETAVQSLQKENLSRFSQWFEEFMADEWDREIEADALAGRFKTMGEKARTDFETGRCKRL